MRGLLVWLFGLNRGSDFKKVDWFIIEARLRQLMEMKKSPEQAAKKQLIIEADKLFDDVLKQSATPGKTMGERLRQLKATAPFKLYRSLWQAHLKRNELVHETASFASDWEVEQHLQSFKEAIEYLRGRR